MSERNKMKKNNSKNNKTSKNSFDFHPLSEELDQIDKECKNVGKSDANKGKEKRKFDLNIEFKTKNREDFDQRDDDLRYIFETLDQKKFDGKLTENGVEVKWSNRLTKNRIVIQVGNDQKPIEIHLSRKLFEKSCETEIILDLYKEMKNTYRMITEREILTALNDRFVIHDEDSEETNCSDIQELFKLFDEKYFFDLLIKNEVEVNWSERLIARPSKLDIEKNLELIRIRLSRKLLRSVPAKGLAETLLHVMIHAFLCVLFNDGPRNHGFKFKRQMERIGRDRGIDLMKTMRECIERAHFDEEEFRIQEENNKNEIMTQIISNALMSTKII